MGKADVPVIRRAAGTRDLAAVTRLFEAYAASLPIDLSYQDFATEVETLPGSYAPPRGALLIATDRAGGPIGCVAMRPLPQAGACEMKRLYVAPAARGTGLGGALAAAIIGEAKMCAYRRMYLDTLPTMAEAQALYRALGFVRTDAYYASAVPETLFYVLAL